MAIEATTRNHALETLRIERAQERPRRKRSRLISIAMLMVLATVLGAAGYVMYAKTIGRPPTVHTMMIGARRDGQPSVLLTGSGYIVTRHKYITIGTKILGQIVSEPIEEGQHVQLGDLLAQIDDRDYQAQLRQAAAARDLSEANLRLALTRAERARQLIRPGAISKDEYDTTMSAAEVAHAALERDTAAVDYAKFEVSQCVITSPINGIVLQKYRELGDTINFGGQIQAGGSATDIAQLADTDDMRAEVDINEADIAKVGIGLPGVVGFDSYPDKQFDAALVKVYPAADRQKGTVKIEVQIARPDLQIIKPEMSVKVSFLAQKMKNGDEPRLIVPKGAIKTDGTDSYVWIVRDGMAKRATIVRGREIETGVEVTQGVEDGDVVIIAAVVALKDGLRVRADQSGSAFGKAQTAGTK